jgi:hypothetical protein
MNRTSTVGVVVRLAKPVPIFLLFLLITGVYAFHPASAEERITKYNEILNECGGVLVLESRQLF